MSDRQPFAPSGPVKVGQVWRDNYDYRTDYVRHVIIVALSKSGETAQIKACSPDGLRNTPKSRITETKVSRFNGGKGGFTLVKDQS